MVVVTDAGNNCLRLVSDTDAATNASLPSASSPESDTPSSGKSRAAVESSHLYAPHVPRLDSWLAAQIKEEEEDEDEGKAGGGGGDESLAYTRALLESSDSSDTGHASACGTSDSEREARGGTGEDASEDEGRAARQLYEG